MALITAAVEEGSSGLHWGGGGGKNVKCPFGHPSQVYISIQRQPKGLSAPFRWSSEIGPAAFL